MPSDPRTATIVEDMNTSEPWVAYGAGPTLDAAIADARKHAIRHYGREHVPPGVLTHQDVIADEYERDQWLVLMQFRTPKPSPPVRTDQTHGSSSALRAHSRMVSSKPENDGPRSDEHEQARDDEVDSAPPTSAHSDADSQVQRNSHDESPS